MNVLQHSTNLPYKCLLPKNVTHRYKQKCTYTYQSECYLYHFRIAYIELSVYHHKIIPKCIQMQILQCIKTYFFEGCTYILNVIHKKINAFAGNRTRVTSMATRYSTTRPQTLVNLLNFLYYILIDLNQYSTT